MIIDDAAKYSTDWTNNYFSAQCKLVLRPQNEKSLSKILQYCNNNLLGIVPQGGNTSLVGGSVPMHDEIVITLEKMNSIKKFDEQTGILTCEAGCIL